MNLVLGTTRRFWYIATPFCLLLVYLYVSSSDSDTSSSYGRGRSLPGFGRSKSAASKRTDAIRSARRQRASALAGGDYSVGANFSEAAPFTFCPTFGISDELAAVYGEEAIMKTRAHVGSSQRVKKVIKRALSGLPITIAVLGGSVSSCHGLDATMAHPLGEQETRLVWEPLAPANEL